MTKNIILIGFMGSGKTTVGKLIADELNYSFIDTDHLVESDYGMEISAIFETRGESYFRELESKALKYASSLESSVIATGGGIITNRANHSLLKKGIVIYLEARPEQIYKNVRDDTSRPLLQEDNVYLTIESMLRKRVGLYESLADYIISVDNKSPEEICNLILRRIQ